MNHTAKDPFGFLFWLKWILWFAASFVIVSLIWTGALRFIFGQIVGYELTITWALSVFGSWFILLVPFVRKKEQVWKRLNADEEKAASLWLRGMAAFVGCVILSCFLWSFVYREEIPSSAESIHGGWLKAVLVTWLLTMLPFLIFLYKKADEIYKAAISRQQGKKPGFRTQFVEKEKRTLPDAIRDQIGSTPPLLRDGHIVHLKLGDGQTISNVFIRKNDQILGVYDRTAYDFDAREVVGVDILKADEISGYDEEKWLRVDGRV